MYYLLEMFKMNAYTKVINLKELHEYTNRVLFETKFFWRNERIVCQKLKFSNPYVFAT